MLVSKKYVLSGKIQLSPAHFTKRLHSQPVYWGKWRLSGIRMSANRSTPVAMEATNGGGGDKSTGIKKTGGNDDNDSSSNTGGGQILTISYALLILIGGVMGYIKRKSKMSLITSLSFSCFMLLCGYGMGLRAWQTPSMTLALLGSGALGGFFMKRYLSSRKPVPGLVGSVLSFAMSIFYLFNLSVTLH